MKIIENRKKFFLLSLVIILIGFGAMAVNAGAGRGMLNWDVEFTGGTSMEIDMGEAYEVEELVEIIDEVTGQSAPQIQQIIGSNAAEIKLQHIEGPVRAELMQMIWEKYPSAELKEANDISGTISREMQQAAIRATAIAGIAMLLYISLRFRDIRAGGSAIIALLHDVLVVLAAYALFRIPVNHTFIAVLLTILGYSINSTIVIFDRVRENNKFYSAAETAQKIDKSISQTMNRSINTSLTTLFTVGAIYVLGVPSIKEFALPMMVGIIAGAYSSICISGSVWYMLIPKEEKGVE
ncbi:MAG: protein translocase subunit SecF [Anaerotignum sp.]|nr:protein translocase subunit SecF [Anaerotignum sp.]